MRTNRKGPLFCQCRGSVKKFFMNLYGLSLNREHVKELLEPMRISVTKG